MVRRATTRPTRLSNEPGYLGVSVGSCDTWGPLKTDNLPSTGVFHHVAVTYTGADPSTANSFQIYLDGTLQHLSQAAVYGCQSQQTRIGAAEAQANQFTGLIRDVRIYDRVISAAEIANLFASGT